MNKWLITSLILISTLQAQAFEDYIVTTAGKLTHISIENNQIIDVFPLITIMNEKNTLIIHPLKEGITFFSVKKNMNESYMFNVVVKKDKTEITPVEGFQILPIDEPPSFFDFQIDKPPIIKKTINIDGIEINTNLNNKEEN